MISIFIAAGLVVALLYGLIFFQIEKEDKNPSNNKKNSVSIMLNAQNGAIRIHKELSRGASNSDVSVYIDNYLKNDNSENSMLNLSEILYANKYNKEAIVILSMGIQSKLNEGKDVSIEELQLIRSAMRDNGSLYEYENLILSIPDDYPLKPQILSEMSVYLTQQGSSYDAEKILLDGLQLYPDNFSVWDVYASFLKSEDRLSEAELAYKHLLEVEGSDEINIKLAKIYLESGNINSAREIFDKLLEQSSEYKEEILSIINNNGI